jgi:DASS family divalent anion:Na+ symporter
MAAIVLIYFYIHYAFASLTSHFISLYAPFLAVLLTAGAPAPLAAYAMLFFTNLSASLTHYGTTHSPIVYFRIHLDRIVVGRSALISFVHLGSGRRSGWAGGD